MSDLSRQVGLSQSHPRIYFINELEGELWRALKTRDPRYHSKFVYGVVSTKIYCRPTCPSRKPQSIVNVVFFASPLVARRSGFRSCRRCNPDLMEKEPEKIETVQKLCQFIKENSQEKLTLERLSKESGLSPFHLQKTFKKVIGLSPKEYVEGIRINHIRNALRAGNSIRRSTYGAGYNTSGWLYFRPNEKLGMSPQKYKRGGEGLKIDYTIRDSPLGKLLVAATEKGICFVSLADSEQKLLSRLHYEFPKADLDQRVENIGLPLYVDKILEYLTVGTDLEISNFPLDVRATAFQSRVWKELKVIPYGKVRTYSEVAKRIGLPKATRAVAHACASNPVPLVVPCHRVVPKSGGVGEYGLGVDRKRALLVKEGVEVGAL